MSKIKNLFIEESFISDYADSFTDEQLNVIETASKKLMKDLLIFVGDGYDLGENSEEIINEFCNKK